MSATVAIVWPCPLGVEEYAAAGRAVQVPHADCPSCGRAMGFWSGYERYLRLGRTYRVWVRRARCCSCRLSEAMTGGQYKAGGSRPRISATVGSGPSAPARGPR